MRRAVAAGLVASGVLGPMAVPGPPASAVVGCSSRPSGAVTFAPIGRYAVAPSPGRSETRGENVVAEGGTMWVMNIGAIDVVDISEPSNPAKVGTLPLPGEPTSVAVSNGLVAVSVPGTPKTDPGRVLFFRGDTQVGEVAVGALPDMVTFTPDGSLLAVANEGEPNSYGFADSVDPEGSISVIVTQPFRTRGALRGMPAAPVTTISFADYNVGGRRHGELPAGIRIFGPGATVAQDLEPEYITVAPDNRTAWVSLQENNALARLDLRSKRVSAITALGWADHSLPGGGIDGSDRNGGTIDIRPWPVKGMFMPDGIATFTTGGQAYVLTANEGDARDWPGIDAGLPGISPDGEEASRARSVADLTAFPAAGSDNLLGRLNVTPFFPASTDPATGKLTSLYSYGSRSFSVRDADGWLLWDSGDAFECITAELLPAVFNASNSNNTKKNRSDDKGPEPEVVITGVVEGRTLAFVGLERIGGVMVYDVSNPSAPSFQQYLRTRDFSVAPGDTDSGPEGMDFLAGEESPTGRPLLLVGNEVSGSVNLFGLA
jgi:hypothetical protein